MSADGIRIGIDVGGTNTDAVLMHFTNSFVQAHGLARVGVLRLAAPATTSLPPFVDWPAALLGEVAGPAWVVRGG